MFSNEGGRGDGKEESKKEGGEEKDIKEKEKINKIVQ